MSNLAVHHPPAAQNIQNPHDAQPPGAQGAQGAQAGHNAQPNALHASQKRSVWKTALRVIGAILTGTISEGVIALVKWVMRKHTAPAQPHLPANKPPSPALVRSMNEDRLASLNLEMGLRGSLYGVRDQVFEQGAARFGLSAADSPAPDIFDQRLESALLNHPTVVTREALPQMVRDITTTMMAEALARNAGEAGTPRQSHLTPQHMSTNFAARMSSPAMRELMNPKPDSDLAALRQTVNTESRTYLHTASASRQAMLELLAEGRERFALLSGLSPELAAQVTSAPVANHFSIFFRELVQKGNTTVADFRQSHSDYVSKFFAARAEAYTSVQELATRGSISEALSLKWQELCLSSTHKITPNLFMVTEAAATEGLHATDNLDTLLRQSASGEDISHCVRSFTDARENVRKEAARGVFEDLGANGNLFRNDLVIDLTLDRGGPDFRQRLLANENLLEKHIIDTNTQWRKIIDTIEDTTSPAKKEADALYMDIEFLRDLVGTAAGRIQNSD